MFPDREITARLSLDPLSLNTLESEPTESAPTESRPTESEPTKPELTESETRSENPLQKPSADVCSRFLCCTKKLTDSADGLEGNK